VGDRDKNDLAAWQSRIIHGCLHDLRQQTAALCVFIVRDDGSILARTSGMPHRDAETVGIFAAMVFASARELLQNLGETGNFNQKIKSQGLHIHISSLTEHLALAVVSNGAFPDGVAAYHMKTLIPRILDQILL